MLLIAEFMSAIILLCAKKKFLTSVALGTMNEAAAEFVHSGSKVKQPYLDFTRSL